MEEFNRYNKQIVLPNFGIIAQQKLVDAKILVIGAGGLGCSILQYLTIAGVGNIGIIDFDIIDLSNLHRQFLYDENSIGKHKVIIAKERLLNLNSKVKIDVFNERITNKNALAFINNYDIIVDGTDNFQTRYLVNDACTLLDKPLVYGAVFQYEGQVSVFNIGDDKGLKTNYRDLFPTPAHLEEVPNCNEAGVLGVLSGMIGTIQANEVIKIITGIGMIMNNKLLVFNILNYNTQLFHYGKSKQNFVLKTEAEFLKTDYERVCNVPQLGINSSQELQNILIADHTVLVDVRDDNELPKIKTFKTISIPLAVLDEHLEVLEKFDTIIFVCQSGIRSAKAVEIAQHKYFDKKITHIQNGIYTIIRT